jgi:hypothetical protein
MPMHKTDRAANSKVMMGGLFKLAAVGAVAATAGMSSPAMCIDLGNEVIAKWPADAQKAAKGILKIHGEPYYTTPTMLIWHESGPWKRIIASNTTTPHNFPGPHPDSVEQFVSYKVPVNKHDEIARFDGSVNIDRTRGEMSARCDAETHNILALNLAHDIIIGKRSVDGARAFYAQAIMIEKKQKMLHRYMLRLNFSPQGSTNDPDDIAPMMRQMRATSDNIDTPKPGSQERQAILRAVRQPVLQMMKRKVVTFTNVKMRANRHWAYVDASSVDSRGQSIGPDFTNELAALVRKHNGRWVVTEWAYATDVISMGWETKYPQVPKGLWPHRR